ncbi:MAG: DUF2726 domain-containing protein [Aquabacterium sp.]|uniref:DUF2726 domain-containing protein n=1 Tax=Aquabacterium sp. TaxID=1872578 RepID=UPI001B7B0508|nr:DUF2726 domain-containing protein [Aquabacterium sp.]MBP7132076.1 DUF2726 domain-containing protein [Aquabacterium sp.]
MDWASLWPALLVGGVGVVGATAAWRLGRGRRAASEATRPVQDQDVEVRPRKPGRPASYDNLDTVLDWEPGATRLLTHAEREAYHLLHKALPEHMILAQVPVARFLKVPTRNSYAEWLRRVGSLCVDLVVCDMASHVLAVVEIRKPPAQETDRTRRRHNRMDKVLQAAHIRVHVWQEDVLPATQAVREAILGPNAARLDDVAAPPSAESSRSRRDAEAAAVVASMRTGGLMQGMSVKESSVDFNLDDPDESERAGAGRHASTHRDPPPSTWFDDLEPTAPAPLDDDLPPSQRSR